MTSRKNEFFCERSVDFEPIERTGDGEDDGRTLYGYAAVFGTATQIRSWEGVFDETIDRGAFKKTLRERKPVMQFDHGHDARVGSTPIGKFTEIKEDDHGLYVEARLFDNPVVEPVRQAIEGGAISGMSFKFQVVRDEWRDKDGKLIKKDELYELLWSPGDRGPLQRNVKEVKLAEAGPVVFPAYPQTEVGVRSSSGLPADLSEEELRDVVARTYASRLPEETPDEEPDAVREDTSGTEVENPEDAVVTTETREDTSKGHKEEPKAPIKRVVPKLPVETKRKESVPMRTIEEMRSLLTEKVERMTAINEEFADAELSDERQAEWDGLEAEVTELKEAIASAEKRQETLRSLAGNGNSSRGSFSAPAVRKSKSEADLHDIDAVRKSAYDADDFVQRCKENALNIAEKLSVPRSVAKVDEARASVLELLEEYDTDSGTLAKRVMACGSKAYERAWSKLVVQQNPFALNADEQRALALGTDSAGGYAVPVQLDPTVILTDTVGISPVRELARVERIVGKEWQGITSGGVTVTRKAEAAEATDDSFTLSQVTIKANRVDGFVPFSYELEDDWGGLRGEITRELARAKNKEERSSFVTGDGTGLNPQGVVTGAQTVTAGGTAAFAVADLYKLEEALLPEYRDGAVMLGNKFIYNKVRQFDTAGGANLWERIGKGQPNELLGYSAYEATAMAAALTTGSKILVFGNLAEGYIIVDRVGMTVELIPNLVGANRRPTGQRGIFAVWRNNAKMIVPQAVKVLVTG